MDQPEFSMSQRFIAAAGASAVAAVVTNPIDVLKVRLQTSSLAQEGPESLAFRRAQSIHGCPPQCPRTGNRVSAPLCVPSCYVYSSSLDAARKIIRREGIQALYRGLQAQMVMTIPMVGIYLPVYDYLLLQLQHLGPAAAPAVAGALSRSLAALTIAPLERYRTRQQAGNSTAESSSQALGIKRIPIPTAAQRPQHQPPSKLGISQYTQQQQCISSHLGRSQMMCTASMSTLASSPYVQQLRAQWMGAGATLLRDVPFSALYWSMLESSRAWLVRHVTEWNQRQASGGKSETAGAEQGRSSSVGDVNTYSSDQLSHLQVIGVNMVAGAGCGAVAAAATTPFDVVKTIRQATPQAEVPTRLRDTFFQIYQRQGFRGFFVGVGLRSARTAPACAIVVASYEGFKKMLSSW